MPTTSGPAPTDFDRSWRRCCGPGPGDRRVRTVPNVVLGTSNSTLLEPGQPNRAEPGRTGPDGDRLLGAGVLVLEVLEEGVVEGEGLAAVVLFAHEVELAVGLGVALGAAAATE